MLRFSIANLSFFLAMTGKDSAARDTLVFGDARRRILYYFRSLWT